MKKTHEEIFYDYIYSLVKNLFIENSNYTNGYYMDMSYREVIEDVKKRGQYILDVMETTKHLIVPLESDK